jgi:hypothetical protein
MSAANGTVAGTPAGNGRLILFAKIFGREVHSFRKNLRTSPHLFGDLGRGLGMPDRHQASSFHRVSAFPLVLACVRRKAPGHAGPLDREEGEAGRRSFFGRTLPGMSERKEQHGRKRAQEMASMGWPVEAQIGGSRSACSGPSGAKRRNNCAVSRPAKHLLRPFTCVSWLLPREGPRMG